MDLYIYPQAANDYSGYGIGVKYAYNKMPPKEDDMIIWYSSYDTSKMLYLKESDIVLRRSNRMSLKSVKNLCLGRIRSEVSPNDLSFLRNYDFKNIHCDEVIFYRALRAVFPDKHFSVRFHNCYSRIWTRNLFLKREIGMKYTLLLKRMVLLEKEIFEDKNVFKIFVSDEDCDFYRDTYGITADSEVWHYYPDIEKVYKNREKKLYLDNNLVWYGGITSHKESSVRWFVNDVLPIIQQTIPTVEFHLWGSGSEKFAKPGAGIYGHGFYNGNGFPLNNSLYLNPDIIGGGIKLKLMNYMENAIPFISTPFGFEGYNKELIDNFFCSVVECDKWANSILSLLDNHKLKRKI